MASCADYCDQEKEVLVVCGDRRRPISFRGSTVIKVEYENLIKGVRDKFQDILSQDTKIYLQIESTKWPGQMVDLDFAVDSIPDNTVINLCISKSKSSSTPAHTAVSSLCQRVGKPTSSSKTVINKLFGYAPNVESKRSFNPKEECVVSRQVKKKKSTNVKERNINVCFLPEGVRKVPKGRSRQSLNSSGRIKKLPFTRGMSATRVKRFLCQSFSDDNVSVENVLYLRAGSDNSIKVNEEQGLDGEGVISLAGQGSLYLCQAKNNSSSSDEDVHVIDLDGHKEPQNSDYVIVSSGSDDDSYLHVSAFSNLPHSPSIKETPVVDRKETTYNPLNEHDYMDSYVGDDPIEDASETTDTLLETTDTLLEWRQIRKEQEMEYEKSLAIDGAKVKESQEIDHWMNQEVEHVGERNMKIEKMKESFLRRFEADPYTSSNSLRVAFKFCDGTKVCQSFTDMTVKDLYQFAFTKDPPLPFILKSAVLMKSIELSAIPLSSLKLDGTVLMVQEELGDIDEFLESLNDHEVITSSSQALESCDYESDSELSPVMAEAFMVSIGATPGLEYVIARENVYNDVMNMYEEDNIVLKFPLNIKFDNELGLDYGGVSRDMFSSFWEEAYTHLFEGASTLIPLLHPQTEMKRFSILGKIISHGYLVCGHLPVRISLPTLIAILLGPQAEISCSVMLDAFRDYINPVERECLRDAISNENFDKSSLIDILARFNCRRVPNPNNLCSILVDVSRFELTQKTAAVIAMMHIAVPDSHKPYWQRLGVSGITKLYSKLSVSKVKVLKILVCDCCNPAEERVFGYLKSFISDLKLKDLVNFIRYSTGSSVLSAKQLKVVFNTSSGFTRAPFAHTCSYTLEVPVAYVNYDDFLAEWTSILSNTCSKWMWEINGY